MKEKNEILKDSKSISVMTQTKKGGKVLAMLPAIKTKKQILIF